MEPARPGNLVFNPDSASIEPIARTAIEPSPPQNNTEDWKGFDEQEFAKIFEQIGFKNISGELDAQDEANKRGYQQTLRETYPAIFKMMSEVGTTNADGLLVPKWHALKEKGDRPLRMLQKESTPLTQAQYCMTVLNLIAFELEYMQLIHEYNEACTRNSIFLDILCQSMPVQFMGNLYCVPIPKSFEINTTAAFAFYLRFTKKLLDAQSQLQPYFNSEDADVFRCLSKDEDPAVKTQISYFAVAWKQQQATEQQSFVVHKIAPLLPRMQAFLTDEKVFEACKHFTPALALLSALDINMCKTTTYKGTFDPKTDLESRYYLPLRKDILQDLCSNYLDRQALIYEKAYTLMQEVLKKNPALEQPVPFLEPKLLRSNLSSLLNKIRSTKVDKSAQFAEAFIKEEAAKKVATTKKKDVRNPSRNKNAKPFRVQKVDFKAKQLGKTDETPKEISRLQSIVAKTLQQPSILQRHERVSRWLKLSPTQLDAIKAFKDYRDGKEVFQYALLNNEELKTQLILHGFSPFVDKLLGNAELKNKYCHQTPRGMALFVELTQENKPTQRGVLHLGLDASFCFHRKIDLKTDQEFLQQSYDQLADWKEDEDNATKQKALKEELELGFEGADEVHFDEKLETISVTDRKLKLQIRIFPLR